MMFTMTADNWNGVRNTEEAVDSPVWGVVESAIGKLDERVRTLVALNRTDGASLFVGGGNGKFVCAFSNGKENLIARSGTEEGKIPVVVGGQEGDFRKRNVLSLDQAKSVAANFFQGRDDLNSAIWERQ